MNFSENNFKKFIKDLTIIWYGPIYSPTGYGQVSRNYIIGLAKEGINVRVIPANRDEIEKIDKKEVDILKRLENSKLTTLRILCVNSEPDLWPLIKTRNVSFIIGVTIFESDGIPKRWVNVCNSKSVDRIWLPTKFNIASFINSGVKKEKLALVPYGIDPIKYPPKRTKLTKKPFSFLYIADFRPRKNVEQLITAFSKEFSNNKNVELHLHLTSKEKDIIGYLRSKGFNNIPANIKIDTQKLNYAEIKDLIASSGAYITVDRANGWGMPAMEAMALRVPAITINWSGSTEFMKDYNSFLIEPTGLEKANEEIVLDNPLYINQNFANVSVSKIQNIMREVYSNKVKREIIAINGHNTIVKDFNDHKINSIILNDLKQIKGLRRFDSDFSLTINNRTIYKLYRYFSNNINYLITFRNFKLVKKTIKNVMAILK